MAALGRFRLLERRVPSFRPIAIKLFSSNDRKRLGPQPSEQTEQVPFLQYAGVGLISYGTIYLSMLGFSYIGLEMDFLNCDMFGLSVDASVDKVGDQS
jgi:hypothetical protein